MRLMTRSNPEMQYESLGAALISPNATFRDALKAIDASDSGIALVADLDRRPDRRPHRW